MTIPVKVRIRRRKAAATCEDSAGRVVQLDLSHVIISVNTGFKELQGRILSLDDSSPGVVNFWGSLSEDSRSKLLRVNDSHVLTEVDRLVKGRVKISGIPNAEDVAQAAVAFRKAMEMDGILRIPDNATLAFVGALRAIESAVGTALVKRLFLRKLCVCLAFVILRSRLGWPGTLVYLLFTIINSPPRNFCIRLLNWLTELIFVSKHDLVQDVTWKTESFLTGMLLLHAIDSVRVYTLVLVSLVLPLFLGMAKKVTASSADVSALDAFKKFILLANQLVLLWFSCTSYGRVLFVLCMFYAQFGWYAFRTGVAITRLPARAAGYLLWYMLSVHDRRRLTHWYSVRKHRNAVLTLCACAAGYLIYKTWGWAPVPCAVAHLAIFYAYIHLLPAEQLLTLILYTMTLPVYLSNMPIDTLARELREWGKEMETDNKTDDRWLEVLCANINKTTSDAIRRRFRRNKEPDPIRTQRIQVAEATPMSTAPLGAERSEFNFEASAASHKSEHASTARQPCTHAAAASSADAQTVMSKLKRGTAAAGMRGIRATCL